MTTAARGLVCYLLLILWVSVLGFQPLRPSSRLRLATLIPKNLRMRTEEVRSSSTSGQQSKPIVGVSTVNNVPFFPRSIEELASDAVFSTRIAFISNLRRVRLDLTTQMTKRERHVLEFLLLYCRMLLDDDIDHVHVFVDGRFSVERVSAMWKEMSEKEGPAISQALTITGITDSTLASSTTTYDSPATKRKKKGAAVDGGASSEGTGSPRAMVIFQPDNVVQATGREINLLEEIQALCFHAALRAIPVVLINPSLMSTSWSDSGAQDALLLGDFAQAYFIRDDYLMIERRRFCGVVQRAATGFDLFLLDGLWNSAPTSATRLQSWPAGYPSNLNSEIAKVLLSEGTGGVGDAILQLNEDELFRVKISQEQTRELERALLKEKQERQRLQD